MYLVLCSFSFELIHPVWLSLLRQRTKYKELRTKNKLPGYLTSLQPASVGPPTDPDSNGAYPCCAEHGRICNWARRGRSILFLTDRSNRCGIAHTSDVATRDPSDCDDSSNTRVPEASRLQFPLRRLRRRLLARCKYEAHEIVYCSTFARYQ